MSLFFSLHEKLPPCQSFVGKEILNESLEDGTLSKILMSPRCENIILFCFGVGFTVKTKMKQAV